MTRAGGPDGGDDLLEIILTDADGDGEQLWALRQAFEDGVPRPTDAHVIGEPVEVLEIAFHGDARRGLVARCRRDDGEEHVVSASEVWFPEGSAAARLVDAYRRWLGLEPALQPGAAAGRRPLRRHKATADDIDVGDVVELVVLAPKSNAARCRLLGTQRELTLRSSRVWDMVPGEIVAVRARKHWSYAGHPYLSGDVVGHRLDVGALELEPLRLRGEQVWDPGNESWVEEGEPLEAWERAIVARGARPSFEMEQVPPGADPDDWDSDPILEASERNAAGDPAGAATLLVEMLADDLRCLDAHAHLGNFEFENRPERAIRHYEVGLRIGELSLGESFEGVLPWGRIDNRSFLRCLHGYGLCLWRLGRPVEAATTFERMLWLNPSDNQGVRFVLPEVRSGQRWEDRHGDR